MPTISSLVSGLGEGWKVVGSGQPIEEITSITNPAANDPTAPEGTQPRLQQGTGRYYVVVQDADGHQRAMYLKASPIKGGLEPPQTGVSKPENEYRGDLTKLDWQQAGAVADVPKSSPQASQALIDDASKANAEQSRASADYATAQADAVRAKQALDNDPQNRALQDASAQATQALNAAQARNQDAAAAAAAADTALKQQAAPGQIALTDAQRQVQEANAAKTAATTPSEIGLNQAQTAAQLAAAAKAAEPTVLTADTVAPLIMTMNPATGKIESQPNGNRITASEATSQLAQQLGLKVAQGSMSEKDAQDLITGAINTMNAQTAQTNAQTQQQQNQVSAAGDILSNVRGNAQTGAGMLQQRAQTAQGMLGQILGIAGQGQRSGNFGGGLMSAPAGLGAGIVNGISGWTSQLMGGQDTLDSAARLVQMADPKSNMADPAMQTAVGALTTMLDKYHQVTGQPHPAVAATAAANQSQQNNGVTAPQAAAPAPNPAYASTGAGAVTAGYGSGAGNPWGNAPNGFPAPVTVGSNPYASSGVGAVGAGFAAPQTGPTIVIHT
jgi:hypothetical protein